MKCIYIFRRLCEIDFISVSRKHNNTRYQLAVPLESLNKCTSQIEKSKPFFILLESFLRHIIGKSDKEAAGVSTFMDG